MLFEVAIIEVPTKKEREEEGKSETLVLPPTAVVANNDKTAAIMASHKVNLNGKDPNRLEVLVRPFAKPS